MVGGGVVQWYGLEMGSWGGDFGGMGIFRGLNELDGLDVGFAVVVIEEDVWMGDRREV